MPQTTSTIDASANYRCQCQLSMPVLFGHCRHILNGSHTSSDTRLVPSTLWPYIRTIELSCRCVDDHILADYWGQYVPKNTDVICAPLASPTLHHAPSLRNMPRLSTIVVRPKEFHVYRHGLTWETLRSFLLSPQVSRLVLDCVHLCPTPSDTPSIQLPPSTSLCGLEYFLPNIRDLCELPSETEALDKMFRTLHLSLEKLSLPTEPTPMFTIPHLAWPRLRELKLRGLRWTSPDVPIVSLFARMPNLRVLVLEIMERGSATATALWPRGYPASYPWPCLESLSLSHPDPDDEIYAHLPPTMHTLMLHSWPHQCIRRWQEANYRSDALRMYRHPPSPSTLLSVLRRCDTPHLRTLGVEYHADSTEISLLSHIATAFPSLATFELHRYRLTGDVQIPMLDIARALAPLSQLRILKVNLNLPTETPPMIDQCMGDTYYWQAQYPEDFDESLYGTATTLAQTLNPCLQQVWHFVYKWFQLQWRIFDVTRHEGNGAPKTKVTALGELRYETEWV